MIWLLVFFIVQCATAGFFYWCGWDRRGDVEWWNRHEERKIP